MGRFGYGLLGLAALGLAVPFVWPRLAPERRAPAEPPVGPPPAADTASGSVAPPSTLYCEFTAIGGRDSLVGFYFAIETPPAYTLILRRGADGAQAPPEGAGTPRPEWRLEAGGSPALIRAPDGTTAIVLHDDPRKPAGTWFEAGLRSDLHENLGGRCRRSAA